MMGVQWLSGRVFDLGPMGLLVQASTVSLTVLCP